MEIRAVLKILRTAGLIAAGSAMLALVALPVDAAASVLARAATAFPATLVKSGGGGAGGGHVDPGTNFGFLDVPQPDYSRPNLDYNLPAPGPKETFKSRAAYCKKTFKTYDARSGTYIGKDGKRHRCY